MRCARIVVVMCAALACACGKKDAPPEASPSSGFVWKDFRDAQYRVPAATNVVEKDGTLPGPNGMGGVPTGVRPSVTLSLPQAFFLEIVRSNDNTSIDGMEHVILANKIGEKPVRTKTANGWELVYTSTGDGRLVHIVHADVAAGHFECTYGEANCHDVAAAAAICASLRSK